MDDAPYIPLKHCSKCNQDKPATNDNFIKDRNRPDGFYPTCKACKISEYRAKHPLIEKPLPEAYKRCSECKEEYPTTLEYFYASKYSSMFQPTCRKCTRALALLKYRQIPKKYHHAKPGATTKVCSKCKIEKPLHCFYKESREHGILKVSSRCSLCINPLRPKNYVQRTLSLVRKCNKCGKEKNIEEFYPDKNKCLGISNVCKECNSRENTRRRQEHYEERREKDHLRYAAYVEAVSSGKIKPLPQRSPLLMKGAEYAARERAMTLGVFCADDVDYIRIYKRDKDLPCYICEQPMLRQHHISFDHVIPITRNGAHSEENIKLVHHECNCRKHTRLLSEMTPFQRRGIVA